MYGLVDLILSFDEPSKCDYVVDVCKEIAIEFGVRDNKLIAVLVYGFFVVGQGFDIFISKDVATYGNDVLQALDISHDNIGHMLHGLLILLKFLRLIWRKHQRYGFAIDGRKSLAYPNNL